MESFFARAIRAACGVHCNRCFLFGPWVMDGCQGVRAPGVHYNHCPKVGPIIILSAWWSVVHHPSSPAAGRSHIWYEHPSFIFIPIPIPISNPIHSLYSLILYHLSSPLPLPLSLSPLLITRSRFDGILSTNQITNGSFRSPRLDSGLSSREPSLSSRRLSARCCVGIFGAPSRSTI